VWSSRLCHGIIQESGMAPNDTHFDLVQRSVAVSSEHEKTEGADSRGYPPVHGRCGVPGGVSKRGLRIECTTCRQQKQPRGRSAPLHGHYCDRDCPGYTQDPQVGSLWPGETAEEFGFPCGDVGTTAEAKP